MKIFTADWHLGDERLELMGRNPPFYSARQMAHELIRNTFSVVKDRTDELYFNGDICYKPDYLEYLKELPVCKRILIRGNHDRQFSDSDLAKYFDVIVPDGDGLFIHAGNLPCYITHYPTQSLHGIFNIVGHIHGIWKCQLNMLNVGIDVHHFYPITEEKVNFYYNSIINFYDLDAWVAYSDVNQNYSITRGRKDRYLDKK